MRIYCALEGMRGREVAVQLLLVRFGFCATVTPVIRTSGL
jgi:hypothetical protein